VQGLPTDLLQEAAAFDSQIEERIANGHIPDLRFAQPCDWFYNSPWRRPAYVQLSFGEQYKLIRDAIEANVDGQTRDIRVLDVGCGPGYLSLELARDGFDVTGIDVSDKCIEVAAKFAAEDPIKAKRDAAGGRLNYFAGDFYADDRLVEKSFDAIVCLGALHHFPDQDRTLARAKELLKKGGVFVAHEPTRDRVTKGNAAFVHMLRILLSVQGGFYKSYKPPADPATRNKEINALFREMRYELDGGGKKQSINDNEAGYAEMHPALKRYFQEIHFEWRYAFFHEFIGGLRFEEAQNAELAKFLRDMDKTLCELGVLQATEFFYVGKKP
jgi:2-polyprenyl-3-methyl-5-hydroxy-6-metoxy-1,4-benzoquinol methylase